MGIVEEVGPEVRAKALPALLLDEPVSVGVQKRFVFCLLRLKRYSSDTTQSQARRVCVRLLEFELVIQFVLLLFLHALHEVLFETLRCILFDLAA